MRTLIFQLILAFSLPSFAQDFIYTDIGKLPTNVNSTAEEIMPMLTPDGQTLYFSRTFSELNLGGINSGQDVWSSQKNDESWAAVRNVRSLNNGENNAVIGINDEKDILYLINNYTAFPRRKQGVVSMRKVGKRWRRLSELPLSVEIKTDHYGFYISGDENILLISMAGEGSLGEEDLYVSFKQGKNQWTPPRHLGNAVNSSGYEIAPFLSADKKYLYFASNGFSGLGDADIYISERLDDSWENWSAPRNLGDQINSTAFDAYYFESEDGTVLFSSNREGGLADIYMGKKVAAPEEPEVIAELPEVPEDTVVAEIEVTLPETVRVHFGFDKYVVTPEAEKILNKVAEILRERPDLNSILAGHTCNIGSGDYNERLSENRAKAVEDYLISQGIPESRIKVEYFGETHPQFKNDSREARRANRRVEVQFNIKTIGKL